ncbi:TPR end-of-group domain-containing protein [Leptolyngbya sp. 7M]|uniref:TPR end-of-group domain-containing protein n=1 Tax=Leptolyngbya sp. 7M TaxID=2812896 RepID=UPI0021F11C92|nr:aquaporin [Leptolyngbya sp. 7M]
MKLFTSPEAIAEGIGTFVLVFAGTGAVMVNRISDGAVTHLGISFVFGSVVAALIYALGHISGAHFNPADQSLKIKPDHANGIYNKGYCYACEGKTALAVDHLAEAIRLNPSRYLPAAKTDPDLESLRKNKRFQAVLNGKF